VKWKKSRGETNIFNLFYARSERILLANCMSFGMIVTRFAWIAHKFVSTKRPTSYASEASLKQNNKKNTIKNIIKTNIKKTNK
jgi:hypothetical protein